METLANYVLETALDPLSGDAARYPAARRCGAIRTKAVDKRTTLLLVRFRYHIVIEGLNRKGAKDAKGEALNQENLSSRIEEIPLLAEDCLVLAFAGSPQNAEWLDAAAAEQLLQAEPEANISLEQASDFARKVEEGFNFLRPVLEQTARQRGEELLEAHQRVRRASKIRNLRHRVEPQLPPDVLGIYVYLPKV